MSRENVELVRRWYALLPGLRDVDPAEEPAVIDGFFDAVLDEGFELRLPSGYPEGDPVFTGREGVAQLFAMLRAAWSEWRFETERFFDVGNRVVVFVRVVARGGGSGLPIELPDAHVVTVRDGRITSSQVYRDRSEALQAVGVEE
ncbi:MAG TPA: nuclear transport factor 2 family protein [Solirubrobacteraceae bacterium]|nr:nuclear transport factor 2 family protein [Solirubrobacteraceae bacterium]